MVGHEKNTRRRLEDGNGRPKVERRRLPCLRRRRMRLVVRGAIFRMGGMTSRRTDGTASDQQAAFASVRRYLVQPLRRVGCPRPHTASHNHARSRCA